MSETTINQELVLLRGSTLLMADTLEEIATLGVDGCWRDPDGIVTDAIGIPKQTAKAIITSKAAAAAQRGLIEKTSAHRRSVRPTNGGRTVRVWRSRIYTDHI